jgi:excisionase family DNA binding protein
MTPRDGLRRPPADRVAVVRVTALLTVATVAELLDCSAWAVRQRIRDGVLPAVREHGRLVVRGDDLRAYVDALEAAGQTVRSRAQPRRKRIEFT